MTTSFSYFYNYNCFCFFDMNRAVGMRPFLHHLGCGCVTISGSGCGFVLQKRKKKSACLERRRIKLVVSAELSSSLSANFGLDSKSVRFRDSSHLPWIGPLPGDIAEVEAYCRIFRAAEWFHNALMDALCNPMTGECSVSYDMPSEDKPLLEDKIVSVLGCMICLLNKGREDVLLDKIALRIKKESEFLGSSQIRERCKNDKDEKIDRLVRDYSASTDLSILDWKKMQIPPVLPSSEHAWLFMLMQPMKAILQVK